MNVYDEAIGTLNKFRNNHYNNGEDEEKRSVAQALNVVLPKVIKNIKRAEKKDELLNLYRNLSMETDVIERSKCWERINKIELEELE